MVAGLAHCHARGVWHLDIKPDNILVSADGRAKVTDFGTATLSQWTLQGCGTLEYTAPDSLPRSSVVAPMCVPRAQSSTHAHEPWPHKRTACACACDAAVCRVHVRVWLVDACPSACAC